MVPTASILRVLVLCSSMAQFQTRAIGTNFETVLQTSLKVAKCRTSCLKGLMARRTPPKQSYCTSDGHPECNMCWFYCDVLQRDVAKMPLMCSDDLVCFTGCKQACRHYGEDGGDVSMGARKTEFAAFPRPTVSDGGVVRWRPHLQSTAAASTAPSPAPAARVYVVFAKRGDPAGTWMEIEQTDRQAVSIAAATRAQITTILVMGVTDAAMITMSEPYWTGVEPSGGPPT